MKTSARAIGFELVGITDTSPSHQAAYYRRWLAAGHGGTMRYLERNAGVRLNPSRLLPEARTIICVAVSYNRPGGFLRISSDAPGSDHGQPTGRVASYARGVDYHAVIKGMLGDLVDRLRAGLAEPFDARSFVDTGPLLERELAARAGLGWIGRNTCLLNADLGSYLLLGEVVTTLDLVPDKPTTPRCGSCTRCLNACPTRALVAPHQMDASRCLSYLTIEQRGEIPRAFHESLGDWVFGCDLCQQVCPYNARAPRGTHPQICAERVAARLPLLELLDLRSGGYARLTREAATRRARRSMWQRNAAIVLGNAGARSPEVVAALNRAAAEEDSGLRAAAQASLDRLQMA